MFRMWGKLWKDNHLIKDMVACNADYSMSRTAMVFQALDEICHEFDLGRPIWLDSNIKDFQLHDKTRFTSDCFIESIDFLAKAESSTTNDSVRLSSSENGRWRWRMPRSVSCLSFSPLGRISFMRFAASTQFSLKIMTSSESSPSGRLQSMKYEPTPLPFTNG